MMAADRRQARVVSCLLFLLPIVWANGECSSDSARCPAPLVLTEASVEHEEEEIGELMRVELLQQKLAKAVQGHDEDQEEGDVRDESGYFPGMAKQVKAAVSAARSAIANITAKPCEDDASVSKPSCKEVSAMPREKVGKYCDGLTDMGAPADVQAVIQDKCKKTCNTCDGIPDSAKTTVQSSGTDAACEDEVSVEEPSCVDVAEMPRESVGKYCETLTDLGVAAEVQKLVQEKCKKTCNTCDGVPDSAKTAIQSSGTDAACEDDPSVSEPSCEDVSQMPRESVGKYCETLTALGAPAESQKQIQEKCKKTCNTCDGVPDFAQTTIQSSGTDAACEDDPSLSQPSCDDVSQMPREKVGKYCETLTDLGAPAEAQKLVQEKCKKTCNTCDGVPDFAQTTDSGTDYGSDSGTDEDVTLSKAPATGSTSASSTDDCTDDPNFADASGITCDMLTHMPTSQRGEYCDTLTTMGLSAAAQKVIRGKCAKVCKTCELDPTPAPTLNPKMAKIMQIKNSCTNLACGKKCLFDEQCAGQAELAAQGVNPNPIYCCPNVKACVDYRLKDQPEKCPMADDVGYRKCDKPHGCSQREGDDYPYSCAAKCSGWDFLNWSDC